MSVNEHEHGLSCILAVSCSMTGQTCNVQVYLRRTDSHVGLGARGNPEEGRP